VTAAAIASGRWRAADDCSLVHLQVHIDVSDELERGEERDCSEGEKKGVAGQQRVAEEAGALDDAGHVRAADVEKHGVSAGKKRRPVLTIDDKKDPDLRHLT